MADESWGLKHVCQFCNALFYDMGKEEPVCPSCGKPHDKFEALRLKSIQMDEQEDDSSADSNIDELEQEAGLDSDDTDVVLEDTSDLDSDYDMNVVDTGKKNDESES